MQRAKDHLPRKPNSPPRLQRPTPPSWFPVRSSHQGISHSTLESSHTPWHLHLYSGKAKPDHALSSNRSNATSLELCVEHPHFWCEKGAPTDSRDCRTTAGMGRYKPKPTSRGRLV